MVLKSGECRGATRRRRSFRGRMGVFPRVQFLSFGSAGAARRVVFHHPVRTLAVALTLALTLSACGDSGGTSSPTPTSPPITAAGKIAFITPGGQLALVNPDGSGQQDLTDGASVKAFQWSPDGSLLAVEDAGGAEPVVWVIRPDGQRLFKLAPASGPAWSPSGAFLAVARDSGLVVVDAAGLEVRQWSGAVRPEWSPDSASLAFLQLGPDGLGVPVIGDVASGGVTPLAADIEPHKPDYPIAWRPSAGVIAYRDALYEPATGKKTALPGVPVNWSPDGRMLMATLAFVPADNSTPAQLLDMTQGGKPVIGLEVRSASDGTPAWSFIRTWADWSPDGRLLVYFDPQPLRLRVRMYDTVAITQKIFKAIKGDHPEVSPDSTHVAFMDEGKVWVLKLDGAALKDIASGSFPAWQPATP